MSSKQKYDPELLKELSSHYEAILRLIGEDPEREGLLNTPMRAAKAMLDITVGYKKNPVDITNNAIFEHDGSRMVIVKDIEFYSVCEHHILPFFGKVSVGYIPDGKMIGLSKVARIVDCYARRLQVQERMTAQIVKGLSEVMPNKGIIIYCEADHLCMKMRGVEKQEASTVTLEYTGMFETDKELRNEFLRMIKQ